MSDYSVRPLDARAEIAAMREIRLEALRRNPEAFCADLDIEEAMTIEEWLGRADTAIWFGGFHGSALDGIVVFSQPRSKKIAHTGEVGAMYVREAARGSGLADALLDALMRFAAGKVEQLKLTVNADNPRAIRFYERHGFRGVGRVPRYIRVGDRVFDELTMVRQVSTSD